MYSLPNLLSVFETLNLKDIVNSILDKNVDFMKGFYKRLEENSARSIIPSETTKKVLITSLEQYTPKKLTPEMLDYLSRMTLRSLVGLPTVPVATRDKEAIKELEGSISWVTEEEIDVTEFIRKMRELE